MSIRDINANTPRPEQYQNAGVRDANRADAAGKSAGTSGASAAGAPQDRVEISDAARAAQASGSQKAELDFARKALDGVAPMSEPRTAEIQQRIQSGFYSQPEVINQVASRLSRVI